MRSNISVGLPIDLLVYETGSLKVALQRRIFDGGRVLVFNEPQL